MVSTAGTMLAMSSTKSSRPDSITSLTQALVKSRTNGSQVLDGREEVRASEERADLPETGHDPVAAVVLAPGDREDVELT